MNKIWTVTFNDGGWHSGPLPNFTGVVAESKDEAIEKVLEKNPRYKSGYDKWASEFTIEGYIIEVYDEKTYNRDKIIDKIL
jgi:hypothetical protein